MQNRIVKLTFLKKVLIILFVITYPILFFEYKIFPYQQIKIFKNNHIDIYLKHRFYTKETTKCSRQKNYFKNENKKTYTFFIAGHTYGAPHKKKDLSLYKNFYKIISKNSKYDFGIFAGDFVQDANNEAWSAVDKQIEKIGHKIYLVAGNHDFDKKDGLYEKRYGRSYYYFRNQKDLFIVLNSTQDKLNIIDDQLKFLKETIKKQKFNNLFIISHHMIWMFNKEIFNSNEDKRLNFTSAYLPKNFKTNFWDDIAPLLLELKNNVYLISGNIGQFPNDRSIYCSNYKNIKFLSTGMGGGKYDNFIIFKNNKKGELKIDFKFF